MPRKPPHGKSLAEVNPELAKEWHPTKNGELTPFDFSYGSANKVWWKCDKGVDHEWEAPIYSRSNGSGCAVCSGKKIVISTSLLTKHPELSKQWDYEKNAPYTPEHVAYGTDKVYWWKCSKGHSFDMSCNKRTAESRSGKCPICIGRRLHSSNRLTRTHSELAKEWHPTKNRDLKSQDVSFGMNKKVWWQCLKDKNHTYKATINNRATHGTGCPGCTNRKAFSDNNLAEAHPKIAEQWCYERNGNTSPNDVVSGTSKKYWWKCDKGVDHIWQARVNERVSGHGCLICSNRNVVESNSLSTTHPELENNFDKDLNNGIKFNQLHAGSHLKVWWNCDKGKDHIWQTGVRNRTIKKTNCPFCTLTPQSRQELIITFELLTIFIGINPKGFKKRIDGTLYSIDIFIPSINIGIEFDGNYWHKDNQVKDKQKTLNIEETGLNLIRVRQKPLERLFDDDVMAEKKFDGKQIINDILKQIVKDDGKYAYKLNKSTLDKIDKYLKLEGLQNEKGLDKYIDQILTEKAERKK